MTTFIGIVGQKGGVAKSTVTRMLAREYAYHDYKVNIADMDAAQGTSFRWVQRRIENGIKPDINVGVFGTVSQAWRVAASFDVVLFDGAPHATKQTREIGEIASAVLLPTGTSVDDLEPTVLLAHDLIKHGTDKSKIAFLLCRVGDSTAEIVEAREYIAQAGYITLEGELHEKTGYRRASDLGATATETRFASLNEKADRLVASIFKHIEEQQIQEGAANG